LHTDFHLLFLRGLGLTVVIETAVLFILLRALLRTGRETVGTGLIVAAGIIASAMTIPYVWFVFPYFIHTRMIYIITAESFAVLAEIPVLALILRVSLPKAALLSFLCNMASFGVGLLIQYLT
jgi:hypothetical protein